MVQILQRIGMWILLSYMGSLTLCAQSQQPTDSMKVDTLREVTVHGGKIRMPLSGSVNSDVRMMQNMQKYSLNGIIQRVSPMLHDQIMHPFGFSERKKSRKRKKVNRILEQYDAIGNDPMELLLDSLARVQGVERHKR